MSNATGSTGKNSEQGLFSRFRAGLAKTRSNFAEGLGNLFLGQKEIDEKLLEEIETRLLMSDVGVGATQQIIDNLAVSISRKQVSDPVALYKGLREELSNILMASEQPLLAAAQKKPFVILMIGVNGAGKTTTCGKLARYFQDQGKSVIMAAGDTYRAAAVEQLQIWGQRTNIPVIAQRTGADSASVIFDALQSAIANEVDVLIADTAGRLHNKSNLMEELKKVKKVMGKLDVDAPHEVMLVIDAGTGQNALQQAKQFQEAVDVSGLTLTKLDGTAKGGIIFAIARELRLPIRFIGVGEQAEDLRPFDADQFVTALFEK